MRRTDVLLRRQLPNMEIVDVINSGKGLEKFLLENGNVDRPRDRLQQNQTTLAHVRIAEREEEYTGNDCDNRIDELGHVLVCYEMDGGRTDDDKEVAAQIPYHLVLPRSFPIPPTRHLQEGDLVVRVPADEEIREAIQQETSCADAEHDQRVVHCVLVGDVEQLANGLDEQGEAQRGHEDAHAEHGQDIDSGPTKCVLQSAFPFVHLR